MVNQLGGQFPSIGIVKLRRRLDPVDLLSSRHSPAISPTHLLAAAVGQDSHGASRRHTCNHEPGPGGVRRSSMVTSLRRYHRPMLAAV
jgi:hypothetical protein